MPSTFMGLNTAYTGLLAANAALNTTANNISNVQTEGYSRQEVNQQAALAIRTFTTYGCVGAGVDVISIERIRDEFYDKKYWQNECSLGEQSTKQYYYAQLETYFADDVKVKGFNTVFDSMYDALDEVRKNASDSTTREQFLVYANGFTQYFNNMYDQLQEMQDDINEEIKIMVDRISTISQQIGVLSKQINSLEVSNQYQKANELRDERAVLVDELSAIVEVETIEKPIYTQSGEPTNTTHYTVKICGGQTLVDNDLYHTLSCVSREDNEKVNQSDIDGLYDIYWDYDSKNFNSDKFHLNNGNIGGKLKGLIDLRDGNNGEYFHGSVTDIARKMYNTGDYDNNGDPIIESRTAVRIEVTSEYLQDLSKSNLAESGQINIAYKDYNYDGFTFLQEVDSSGNTHYYYELYLSQGQTLDRSVINRNAYVGGSVDYQGIPYYQQQMSEWIRTYSETFNNILTDNGIDGYGNQALNMFVANAKVDDQQYNFSQYEDMMEAYTFFAGIREIPLNATTPAIKINTTTMTDEDAPEWLVKMADEYNADNTSADVPDWFKNMVSQYVDTGRVVLSINNQDNSYYKLTADSFDVADYMKKDPQLFATHTSDYDGESISAYDIVEKLQRLKTDKSMMSFRGGSAGEFLQNITADVALNSSTAKTFTTNFTSMEQLIENQRYSVSGVDEDEEAANLVKYQMAYNLSSKMIQTLTEVYDRLILSTGV